MSDRVDEKTGRKDRLDLSRASVIALGEGFDYVSAVDLETQEEQIFKYNPAFMSLVPGWGLLETYHDRMRVICNLFVHPNDRAAFLHDTDLAVLNETLTKDAPRKYVNFRELIGDTVVYYQGQYTLLDMEGVRGCTVCFRNVDTETRKHIFHQSMEEAISDDYECLLHVDLESMEEDHYRISDFFSSRVPGFAREKNYLARTGLLADTLVHPEDKERFLAGVDPAVVSEKVKGSVPYYVDFRVCTEDGVHWFQAKYVHHSTHGDHNCAILGITNIDDMMAQKERNEEILRKNLRLIEGVASNFASVVYVDLETGSFTYHVVQKNRQEQYDRYGLDSRSFDEAFRAYAKDVIYENEQESIIEAFRLDNMRERLTREPQFTETFRTVDSGRTALCQIKAALADCPEVTLSIRTDGTVLTEGSAPLSGQSAAGMLENAGRIWADLGETPAETAVRTLTAAGAEQAEEMLVPIMASPGSDGSWAVLAQQTG